MTVLTGDIKDVGHNPTEGTIKVRAASTRAGNETSGVITREIGEYKVENGMFQTDDLDPGPIVVELTANGTYDIWRFDLPSSDEPLTLDSLVEHVENYSPKIVRSAQAAASKAEAASIEAARSAGSAAASAQAANASAAQVQGVVDSGVAAVRDEFMGLVSQATAARDSAGVSEQVAKASAEAAAGSEQDAQASAEAAAASAQDASDHSSAVSVSAAAASADADRAAEQAQAANAAAESINEKELQAERFAAEAGEHANRAAASAEEATRQADRATSEADRAGQAAEASSVKAVSDRVNELLAGAPEAFDTLKEVADALVAQEDAASAMITQIAGKADAEHTHQTADVEGLDSALASKAEKSHSHEMSQITGLSDELAGKAAKSEMEARPAMFSGTGAPPSSIPNAVVGDWWLDTDSLNLYRIEGV